MKGQGKTPSTAFCLLLRLFTLRCSEKQMTLMLNHVDSPYIRCIGFMYLRYASDPQGLWDWFQPYLYDEEPVRITSKMNQPETTMGEFVRSLLTDMDYFGTLLPRLPVTVERDVKVKLLQEEITEERALKNLNDERRMAYFQTVGSRIRALYGDEENPVTWYVGVVDRVVRKDDETGAEFTRPKFVVTFPEYGNTELVSLGEIDMLNDEESSSSSRYGSRHNNHHRSRDYDQQTSKHSYNKGREQGQSRNDKRGYRDGDSCHGNHHSYDRRWKRSRSRSRDRGSPPPSDTSSRQLPNDADLMEEVRRREREKTAAKGRAYASRPSTFKESMSTKVDEGLGTKESASNYRFRTNNTYQKKDASRERTSEDNRTNSVQPPVKKKTPEELAAIAEKKRKLMAKYG